MNDIFDFRRFGKLLAYEYNTYLPRFAKSLVMFSALMFAFWVATIVIGFNFIIEFRIELIAILFNVSCMLAPFIVYRDMNNRRRGYFYAMLPASTLEKFLSMSLMCLVVAPLISFVIIHSTDLLLHWLTLSGIGGFVGIDIHNPFETGITETLPSILLSYFTTIGFAMMFNTIFRKHKIIKTILVYMASVFSMIMLFFWLCDILSVRTMSEFTLWSIEGCFWHYVKASAMVAAFVYTYFRIRNVNY